MGLEWRTLEDEEGRRQEEVPKVEARAPKRRSRLRRFSTSLVLLLLLVVVIWGVRYVFLRRLDAIAATVEAEVLAVHGIVQEAERDRDSALFGGMISPDYPNWGKTQKGMLRSGIRWDRPFFGLALVGGADEQAPTGQVVDVAFTSDWGMATVTLAFPYTGADGSPVTLHQIVTYRDEKTSWVLVPAYPSFWGEKQTFTGRYLTVEYPERDADTVEQLAREWDAMLAAVCGNVDGLRCRRSWRLKVTLSTESGSLARMAEGAPSGSHWDGMSNALLKSMDADGPGLKLPTPSLIGSPVDDAGYQAVRAGYAPLIVSGGIADVVGWRCCEKIVFFRALLDKQLSRLGIIPWPLEAASYEEILQGSIHDVTNLHWVYLQRSYNNITPYIQKMVYSIVDFILASNPQRSPASLQRLLFRFDTYSPWLLNALPYNRSQASQGSYMRWLQKEWIRYADQQLAADTAPARALPEQDLQLLCTAERFNGANLYRYNLQEGEYVEENGSGSFRLMYSLPNDDGVLLQRLGEWGAAASTSQVQIWREGRAQDVTYRSDNAPLYAVGTNAGGMLFYSYDNRRQPTSRFNYLSQAECDKGACAIRTLEGMPAWPPDGERTVVVRGDGVLWLGNEVGETQMAVGRGRSVAWLDNRRFAFIQPDEGLRVDEVTLPNLALRTLVEMERLAGALQNATDVTEITPVALAAHPALPDRLYIGARVEGGTGAGTTHVFVYDLTTDEITKLLQVDNPLERNRSLRFSADGLWLFVHSVERSPNSWHLHIYNNQTGEILNYSTETSLAFPGYDLSADGAWLVRVDDGFLHLISLNGGRQRLVAHDFAHCYAAVWVN